MVAKEILILANVHWDEMRAALNAPAQAIVERRAERERGEKLTVLQRLAAEDAAIESNEPKRKARAGASKKAVGALAVGATIAGSAALFGRVRLHAEPKQMVDGTGEERRNMLLDRGWCRRTVQVHAVGPSGDAEFEAVDEVGREQFAAGDAGADAHEEAFLEYLAGNFDDAGIEVMSMDRRDLAVGHFGNWMERVGHGKYVEWLLEPESQLYQLKPVMTEVEEIDGVPMKAVPLVPRAVAVLEYAIKKAIGHPSTPKGGDPDYMNGPWYKSRHGRRQGAVMKGVPKKKYGRGVHSTTKRVSV